MENIVTKPWGYENRWAVNEKYLGKLLKIQPDCRLSRQYHEQKDETIYVLEGRLILQLGQGEELERHTLTQGQSWRIKPGTIHRFCASEHGCVLIEVSTPEIDDVVRLEDDYQRE